MNQPSQSGYAFKAKYGSMSVSLRGDIVYGKFSGALSCGITKRLMQAIPGIIAPLNGQPWGYISFSESAQAATPSAEEDLVKCVTLFHQLGCSASAYILSSPVAKEQLKRVRIAAGAPQPIDEILFDDIKSAEKYIRDTLSALSESSNVTA